MKIRLISREEIDTTKWNSCVHFAINGNVFGYKWYIDAITKDWEALVEDDYASVMPLIWKKNWLGKKRLYIPSLMRESGIYSANPLSEKRVSSFLEAIPNTYRKAAIQVDQFTLPPNNQNWSIEKKNNHLVYMNRPYDTLSEQFSDKTEIQLALARSANLRPTNSLKPEKIADFYKAHSKEYTKENYHAYLRIMYNVLHRGWGFASGVVDSKDKLLAVNFLIFSHGRLVSFLPVVSKEGQGVGALEFLVNLIFHTNANRQVLFDYNESEQHFGFGEEVATFYEFTK